MNPGAHLSGAYLTPYNHQGQALLLKEQSFHRVWCPKALFHVKQVGLS